MPAQLSLDVPRDRAGFRMARAVIQQYLNGDVTPDELSDVSLIMSELITNAVVHGEGTITLRLTVEGELIRGEVVDAGGGFEREIRERGPDEIGGRGLLLVASLAQRWGVHEGSSHVWFELDRTRRNKAPEPPQLGAEHKGQGGQEGKAQRSFNALEVDDLLEVLAATEYLEHNRSHPTHRNIGRRIAFALLFFAGLRISEVTRVRWRDWNEQAGTLGIGVLSGDGKTISSVRYVNVVPALRRELEAWREQTRYGRARDYICPTARGTQRTKDNARQRIIDPVVAFENGRRTEASGDDAELLPHVTSHTGRRTFATNLAFIGEMPDYIQDQLGHSEPGLAMRLYRQRRQLRTAPDPRLFELYGRPHHLS